MFTYWYPRSLRPVATRASAVSSISWAETPQPKAFQLLNPIGGVGARVSAGGGGRGGVGFDGAATA